MVSGRSIAAAGVTARRRSGLVITVPHPDRGRWVCPRPKRNEVHVFIGRPACLSLSLLPSSGVSRGPAVRAPFPSSHAPRYRRVESAAVLSVGKSFPSKCSTASASDAVRRRRRFGRRSRSFRRCPRLLSSQSVFLKRLGQYGCRVTLPYGQLFDFHVITSERLRFSGGQGIPRRLLAPARPLVTVYVLNDIFGSDSASHLSDAANRTGQCARIGIDRPVRDSMFERFCTK